MHLTPPNLIRSLAVCGYAALASTAIATPYSDVIQNDNPVVYYQFDEAAGSTTAVNSGTAGTDYDTDAVGAPVFGVAAPTANMGTAVELAALGDHFAIGNGSHYTTWLNGKSSLEFWINVGPQSHSTGTQGWNQPSLMGDDNGGSCCGGGGVDSWWGVIETNSGGTLGAIGANTPNPDSPVDVTTAVSVTDNTWHHIVITRDDADGITTYLDGALSSSGTLSSTPDNHWDTIGRTDAGDNGQIIGFIDEVAIYDVELTAAQVAVHFSAAAVDPDPVINLPASDIAPTSATLNGQVLTIADGEPAVVIRWGDEDGLGDPDAWDHAEVLPGTQGLGAFSAATSSPLVPATTYFFRAFATNGAGETSASPSLAFTTPTIPSPYSRAVQADNPVVYYRFDENAGATSAANSGSAGPDYDTAAVGSPVFGQPSAHPTMGMAVQLAAQGDHFDIPGTTAHYTTWLNGDSSLEFWMKVNYADLDTSGAQGWNQPSLMGSDNAGCCGGGGSDSWWGSIETNTDNPGGPQGSIGVNTGNKPTDAVTAVSVTDDMWHHIVLTRSGTDITTYVDGALSSTGTLEGTPNNTWDTLGRTDAGNRSQILGLIDEVAIYDTPLSAAQVANHFAAAIGSEPFAITDFQYSSTSDTITLTWRSRAGESYIVKYSLTMADGWGSDIGDGITAANDEIAGDGDQITVTFDLSAAGIAGETDVFFRVETE